MHACTLTSAFETEPATIGETTIASSSTAAAAEAAEAADADADAATCKPPIARSDDHRNSTSGEPGGRGGGLPAVGDLDGWNGADVDVCYSVLQPLSPPLSPSLLQPGSHPGGLPFPCLHKYDGMFFLIFKVTRQ